MTTPCASVLTLLEADTDLTDILVGGIHNAEDTNEGDERHPIHPDTTPDAYVEDDAGFHVLQPCALLRESTDVAVAGGEGRQIYIHVYLYDSNGYSVIQSAMVRIRELLHRTPIEVDGKGGVMFHEDNTKDKDNSIMTGTPFDAQMIRMRFLVLTRWPTTS